MHTTYDKHEERSSRADDVPEGDEIVYAHRLHRTNYPIGSSGMLAEEAITSIAALDAETFIWVACEKKDVRTIKGVLKARNHDPKLKYVAWYWERGVSADDCPPNCNAAGADNRMAISSRSPRREMRLYDSSSSPRLS
ncbi:SIP domain-containing protein [Agrobacterium sp. a22-2]|uniref:SIP domain-containing protein n=1 Tax=Agrobacterium sp. a22-2 TaxID=2283840 RepID=UPI0034CDDF7E